MTNEINAFRIEHWMDVMHEGLLSTKKLDDKSEQLLRKLFDVTAAIKPIGDDDLKVLWVQVKRPSLTQYRAYYKDRTTPHDKMKSRYLEEYPDKMCWYKLRLVRHGKGDDEFFGGFIDNNYILSINDCNSKGYPVDASELLEWLIEQATDVVDRIKAGTYNTEISENLPKRYRYGRILRKDYWDIYPEEREVYLSAFTQQEIDEFVALESEFKEGLYKKGYPANAWESMTPRQYYEACAVVYKTIHLPLREKWKFIDSDAEHEKYGETTPKEMYYMFADGRDNGLQNVPMDDASELNLWLEDKGEYYEFNGSHPWEIIPSYSISHSMHLGISHDPKRKFLFLSGDKLERSKQTIRAYLALRKAGFPVELVNGDKMVARLKETDYIEIMPYYCHSVFGSNESNMLDAITLDDGDKPELVASKAIWNPLKALELKDKIE